MKNVSFRFFFTPAVIGGIIGILFALYLDAEFGNVGFLLGILIDFIKTISISIFIAGIFTWVSSSENFINKIRNLLKSIITDRTFLKDLNDTSKKDVLKLLLPLNQSQQNASDINSFINYYIDNLFNIVCDNIRQNYIVESEVYYSNNKIICDKIFRYRLLKNRAPKFNPITIGMSDEDIGYKVSEIIIQDPNGTIESIKNISLHKTQKDGEKMNIANIQLDKYNDRNFIDIIIKTQEIGYDHWYTISNQVLGPTEGMTFKIICKDNIVIKAIDIFSSNTDFKIEENEDKNRVLLYTNQWINPGSGIHTIVAIKSE